MLTLFPNPANQPEKPKLHPIPRRLQLLPIAMLAVAALLELAAWHRNSLTSAAAHPRSAQLAAAQPQLVPPGAAAPRPSSAELTREAQKARELKTRSLQLYANPDYSISLSYPRSFILKESTDLADEDNPLLRQRTDGSPDQQLLARIELPDNVYPRTDFLAGYLSLSVNRTFTAEQCAQSIGVEEEGDSGARVVNGIPFHSLETTSDADGTHESLREYSTFSNDVCYEIELGVVTLNDGSIAPVNHDRVFSRLDAILRTIRITQPQ
jgi:hypothetical protein